MPDDTARENQPEVRPGTPAEFLHGNEKLYALSSNYFAIYEAVNDPEKTFQHISGILSCDPAFSARLLKIVNSPYYGFPQKIETLEHAVSLVGTEQLCDLIFATAIVDHFRGVPHNLFNEESFWKHNVGCGLLARELGKMKEAETVSRFFLAGILHDLGRLLLCMKEPEAVRQIYETSHRDGRPVYESEEALFGFDHAALCAELLNRWNMPERLVECVRWHHHPERAPAHREDALILHAADGMAHHFEYGLDEECLGDAVPEAALAELGLGVDVLPEIRARVDGPFHSMVDLVL